MENKLRILCTVGRYRDGCYDEEKQMLIPSKLRAVSIWNVFYMFAQQVKDHAFVYMALLKPSKTPGVVEELPLQGVNGVLLVVHVDRYYVSDLRGISQMALPLRKHFSYAYPDVAYHIDAVYSATPQGMAQYDAQFSKYGYPLVRPALAVRTCSGITFAGGKAYQLSAEEDHLLASDLISADLVLTNGPQVAHDFVRMAQNMLNSAHVLRFRNKIKYISHGAPILDPSTISLDRDRVVGFFGRYDNVTNKVDKLLAVYDRLYRAGKIDRVLTTTNRENDNAKALRKLYPYLDFRLAGPEYLDIAQEARTLIYYMGNGKSCALGMIEQMARGIVPVVPYGEAWADAFFKLEDKEYPFRFQSQEEADAMLISLLEDDALYKKWAKRCMAIASRFELSKTKLALLDAIEETVQASYMWQRTANKSLEEWNGLLRSTAQVLEVAEKLYAKKGYVAHGELIPACAKAGITLVMRTGYPIVCMAELRQLLFAAGYVDPGNQPEPRYVKKGDV